MTKKNVEKFLFIKRHKVHTKGMIGKKGKSHFPGREAKPGHSSAGRSYIVLCSPFGINHVFYSLEQRVSGVA